MKIRQLVETEYGNHINLTGRGLSKLPPDLPHSISGNFQCKDNDLTTLEGCPSQVGDYFWCQNNMLTSLKGCPSQVGGGFQCQYNQLTSLEHCPSRVGGDFWCHENKLTSLHNIHEHISNIGRNFVCKNNPIQSHILGLMMIEIGREISTGLGNGTDVDEILNKWKNQGRKGVLGCQRDLIDAGYKELAQL